jgi:hypothetical protein
MEKEVKINRKYEGPGLNTKVNFRPASWPCPKICSNSQTIVQCGGLGFDITQLGKFQCIYLECPIIMILLTSYRNSGKSIHSVINKEIKTSAINMSIVDKFFIEQLHYYLAPTESKLRDTASIELELLSIHNIVDIIWNA